MWPPHEGAQQEKIERHIKKKFGRTCKLLPTPLGVGEQCCVNAGLELSWLGPL